MPMANAVKTRSKSTRDPRSQAIRKYCKHICCCDDQKSWSECCLEDCFLWPYRMGYEMDDDGNRIKQKRRGAGFAGKKGKGGGE